jgi:small subunit ribosomal protein S6
MATQVTGKLPGYETTIITRPDMSDEAVKALQERLTGVVSGYKGTLVIQEDWGRRKLAYPIQKETRGHYTYLVYTGQGDIVHEIERNLRLQDTVLRFLTVNLEKEFDAEVFTKRRAELAAAAKKREEEREARRLERMNEEGRGGYRGGGYRGDRGDRGDRYGAVQAHEEAGAEAATGDNE